MMTDAHQKVSANHLNRKAFLYIRQSTPRQLLENVESTQRQYALRQRAAALGWALEQIIVIDNDQGHSGAYAADREGFQRLVTEVSLGHAGVVLGLEVSRLARNNADWHRLLEICAFSDTLILDEDGVYDPTSFNDRLLLGLKGAMSEAELHVMKARMRGGILNKAKRGELELALPIGLIYSADGPVILDPDKQVQQSIRLVFDTFQRTGSAYAVVKLFHQQSLLFPRRPHGGPNKGELLWAELVHSQVIRMLHNPRYAGAFVFGRTRTRRQLDGRRGVGRPLPREEWTTLLRDAHPGYISWEEYEDNLQRLRENACAHGSDRRRSPAREGPALLQGLVVCGICGDRMTIRYHARGDRLVPDYVCCRQGIEHAQRICQQIPGADIDLMIGKLLVEAVTPMALEVALSVQQELQSRQQDTDRLRQTHVERARYEANMARRRYLQVDPDHRLVADTLEADWNQKLRDLEEAQQEYERQRQADQKVLGAEEQARIFGLSTDFRKLWEDPKTPDRERKRMVRLIIEDATLIKKEEITAHIRFRGGAVRTLSLPIPLNAWQVCTTKPEIVAQIDRLLDRHTNAEIAIVLNEDGRLSGKGQSFTRKIVSRLVKFYGLKSRYNRLRETGLLTRTEMAELLGTDSTTVWRWQKLGLLRGYAYNDKNECLLERPDPKVLLKLCDRNLREVREVRMLDRPDEVQYEA